MTKAIIFDIAGVVYKGDMLQFNIGLAANLGVDEEPMIQLFSDNGDDLILGKIAFIDILGKFLPDISRDELIRVAKKTWSETFALNSTIVKLISDLQREFVVGCLSNSTDFDVEMDEETGIKDLFDPYINSSSIQLRKPDSAIFNYLLNQLYQEPRACIFIDDNKDYLLTPREMGFNVLLYENALKLSQDLRSLGVINQH